MALPETPQDRPLPSNSYGPDQGTNSASVGTMQHDLEVAQACLNLRQESKGQGGGGAGGSNSSTTATSITGGGGTGLGQGQIPEQRGHGNNGDDPRNTSQTPQMDQRPGGMNHMAPMPPIPPPGDGGGRMPMQMGMMPGPFMPSHAMMDHLGGGGGPNTMPPSGTGTSNPSGGDRNNGPGASYYNMVDNSSHFYPQMPHDAEQYHAMMNGMNGMNGMGSMRDMPYYNMNMMNHSDPNMMNHNSHFYPPMMPPDSGHFNSMMGNYPQGGGGGGGGYMQQKRQHPDDFSMANDFKRRRSNNPNSPSKVEDTSPVQKKLPEKQKKGKRASDMPRRPLSAYNFFFSEERERILAAIPDPDGETEEKSSEKATETNTQSESDPLSKKEDRDGAGKPSEETCAGSKSKNDGKKEGNKELKGCEEVLEKMAARSKRLLDLREQSNGKRRPHRKTHGKIGFKELVKKIGERWRALQPDEREYYSNLAEKDLARYKEQMTEYNNKHNRISS
mmetsp:Transcript_5700/g.7014  ORF Transcript_5700/g.7014 Transcript_5700/m.7014 type:complete len:502 (-) Transcript_5700:129-1634(-)|eukprot:CAMPEP_0203674936 /NCGR_PEP_ID=MMETSP0090-20130426/18040_1 /ASSEMBLY_ACC=CAM_ASM_001088 /TAXON_ID=426623 /ORGANISM="Chaetoceros affinis, Strain CCMP159" /LENGTH=501 /DNA_ID=CAMNT_0050540953 /DNA_START=44 /DNA_END=1549 /DNA_ORIENTATION=+